MNMDTLKDIKDLALTLDERREGLNWPRPPVFGTLAETRTYRKQRLAIAYRIFAACGFDWGIGGHITCRDPEHHDCFWVNPIGLHFSKVRASDLVLVDHAGKVVEGKLPINSAAYAIHSRIHMARPDVVAVAHAHSRYGTAFATLGRLLAPISQEACSFYRDHALYDAYGATAADFSEGDGIARALGPHKAVVCRNHGLLTVGHTVEEAAWWFIRMERACEQTLLAGAIGTPVAIDDATATLAARQVGSHGAGWFSLQPMVEKLVSEQPDVLS